MKISFKRNCDMLDERQLLIRGNVFQHTMIYYMFATLLNGWLTESGIVWAPGMMEGIIIFWLGTDLALCEYILRDVTPKGGGNDILYILQGICGGILLILNCFHIADGRPLVNGSGLTREGGHMTVAALMLVIFLTYLFKRIYDRFKPVEEEE